MRALYRSGRAGRRAERLPASPGHLRRRAGHRAGEQAPAAAPRHPDRQHRPGLRTGAADQRPDVPPGDHPAGAALSAPRHRRLHRPGSGDPRHRGGVPTATATPGWCRSWRSAAGPASDKTALAVRAGHRVAGDTPTGSCSRTCAARPAGRPIRPRSWAGSCASCSCPALALPDGVDARAELYRHALAGPPHARRARQRRRRESDPAAGARRGAVRRPGHRPAAVRRSARDGTHRGSPVPTGHRGDCRVAWWARAASRPSRTPPRRWPACAATCRSRCASRAPGWSAGPIGGSSTWAGPSLLTRGGG